MLYDQRTDLAYRRLYYYLHTLVDAGDRCASSTRSTTSGMADDTIVVFTSDHGDLLGAHGGLLQKWHNAFDEAIRVPLLVSGPGIDPGAGRRRDRHQPRRPDPHAAGARRHRRRGGGRREWRAHHVEAQPLPGRDLSGVLTGACPTPVRVDERRSTS